MIAVLLLVISVAAHAAYKWRRDASALPRISWATLALGVALAVVPIAGSFARPAGAVVHRGAPLLDAASPTAETVSTLREGEVVPILERSGDYVRVEDSSGARGWASVRDVRALDPSASTTALSAQATNPRVFSSVRNPIGIMGDPSGELAI